MLSQVFTCTNVGCRINSFMGSYVPGTNICPGCAGCTSGTMLGSGIPAIAGYHIVYYSSGSYSPMAAAPAPALAPPAPPPPPKGLEEAVKEDIVQILTDITEDIRRSSKVAGLSATTAQQLENVAIWLEEEKIAKYVEAT